MLQFSRKQMMQIGRSRLHDRLSVFLRGHVAQACAVPRVEFDRALTATLSRARELGLDRQGAVAAYVLACCRFGSANVESDPVLKTTFANRRMPQREKALLLRVWMSHAARALPRERR